MFPVIIAQARVMDGSCEPTIITLVSNRRERLSALVFFVDRAGHTRCMNNVLVREAVYRGLVVIRVIRYTHSQELVSHV